jgi:hypothetical protein
MIFPAAAAAAVDTVGKATAPKSVAVVMTLFEFVQMPPPFTPMYAPVQVITGGGTNAGGGLCATGDRQRARSRRLSRWLPRP